MTGKRIVWRDKSQQRVRLRRRQQGCKFVVLSFGRADEATPCFASLLNAAGPGEDESAARERVSSDRRLAIG